jgi:hypothetical protein
VIGGDQCLAVGRGWHKIDDHLGKQSRHGRPPQLTDAELLILAVAQALLGIRSEARWLRFLPRHGWRSSRPTQPTLTTPGSSGASKLDEHQVLMAVLNHDPSVLTDRPGLLIIADKGYISRELDGYLAERGARLPRLSQSRPTPSPEPAQTSPATDSELLV